MFSGLEVPDQIRQITKQRIVVHHLGSGLRLADNLGIEREVISFRGTFAGAEASDRIRALDYLRRQKIPQTLAWGPNAVPVVIQVFELDYLSPVWVPYRLSCYVLPSVNPIPAATDAILLTSPAAAMSDILNLLQGSPISVDSDQVTALETLAALNFDVPPVDAMGQAQALVTTIDSCLSSVSDAQPGVTTDLSAGTQMAAAVAASGQESALILARNRIMGVVIAAGNPE